MSVEIIKYGNPVEGVSDGIIKGILETAIKITGQAAALAPVGETGALRNSLTYKVGSGERGGEDLSVQPKPGEGYVGSNIKYAIYQEYGTRYMRPQPFLRPAVAIYGLGKNAADIMKKKQQEEMKGALGKGKRVNFFN